MKSRLWRSSPRSSRSIANTPAGQDTNASSVRYRVTFNGDVTGVDPTDFVATVVSGGLTGASVTTVTPVSASVYTVDVNTGTGTGTLRLDLVDDDSIASGAVVLGGVGTNGSFSTGQSYVIDRTPLTVTVEQAVGQADPTSQGTVSFTAVFNKDVTDFTDPDVTITGTALLMNATVAMVDAKTYTINVATTTTSGTVIASLAAGVAHDAAGNPNTASTSIDNTITVDKVVPTVASVSALNVDGSYGNAAVIHITVKFSEAVLVTGAPELSLNLAPLPVRVVKYVSGSGTDTLVFDYTVNPADNVARLDYASTSALALAGGTIADAATNSAVLTLPAPGAAGSLGANKNIVIDTAPHLLSAALAFWSNGRRQFRDAHRHQPAGHRVQSRRLWPSPRSASRPRRPC